jgi:hypothetical protein
MTKYNPTQNIRRSLKLWALALATGSALWLSGCRPARWDSVTIQEVNAQGVTMNEWKNVRIEWARDSWTRFKTPDGQLMTISTPHRLIYK